MEEKQKNIEDDKQEEIDFSKTIEDVCSEKSQNETAKEKEENLKEKNIRKKSDSINKQLKPEEEEEEEEKKENIELDEDYTEVIKI